MIRKLMYLFIAVIFSCASASLFLTEDQVDNHVFADSKQFKKTKFFLLSLAQVSQLRAPGSPIYLGSDSTYHYLESGSKITEPGEIRHAAIKLDDCTVINPRPIDIEVNFKPTNLTYHPWRIVYIDSCDCVVKHDSSYIPSIMR